MSRFRRDIFHVMPAGEEKHTLSFINILSALSGGERCRYFIVGDNQHIHGVKRGISIEYFYGNEAYKVLLQKLGFAEKIIMHGIWPTFVCDFLAKNPKLMKKTVWIPWGGDFYFPEKQPSARHEFIRMVPKIISASGADKKYIIQNYSANADFIKMFPYPVSVFREDSSESKLPDKINRKTRILVGNSATRTCNHYESFVAIEKANIPDKEVICPLGYGLEKVRKNVIQLGRDFFGDSFFAINSMLGFSEYRNFLKDIDIAVFAHDRQQALGNCYILLSLGKTLYLKARSPIHEHLTEYGFHVRSLFDLGRGGLDSQEIKDNVETCKKFMSREIYLENWERFLLED